MASIVLGLGTSHSPQLNIPPEYWLERGQRDRNRQTLLYRSETYTFDELVQERASENLEDEITLEKVQQRHAACQEGIAGVAEALREADPDILLVVGDDQDEMLNDDNRPPLLLYCGEDIQVVPRTYPADAHPSDSAAGWAYGEEHKTLPGAPDLAEHMMRDLTANDIDVAYSTRLPEGHGIGHAFAFVYRRIMDGFDIPTIPVMINTYFPPNAPTSSRCYDYGKALRQAVESWDSDARVAIIASGGLTHFVIDEEFDRTLLDALEANDEDAIKKLPEPNLMSGTSEGKNWIATAGAAADLSMSMIDYVPSYRSEAGTGCAMGFAKWV